MVLVSSFVFRQYFSEPQQQKNLKEPILKSSSEEHPASKAETFTQNRLDFNVTKEPVVKLDTTATSVDKDTAEKVRILYEIISAHSDNDPRLDLDLRHLSSNSKKSFREVYDQLPLEERNARGTVVFLLGRNINEPEDFDFLKKVLAEEPCLSLDDCRKAASTKDDALSNEQETPRQLALNYPQAVVLESLDSQVTRLSQNEADRKNVQRLLRVGIKSQVPLISQKAQELLQKM